MSKPITGVAPYRVGEWLPSDQAILNGWLEDLIREVEEKNQTISSRC